MLWAGSQCKNKKAQKVYIHTIVYLDGAQVNTEYFLTLIKVG